MVPVVYDTYLLRKDVLEILLQFIDSKIEYFSLNYPNSSNLSSPHFIKERIDVDVQLSMFLFNHSMFPILLTERDLNHYGNKHLNFFFI